MTHRAPQTSKVSNNTIAWFTGIIALIAIVVAVVYTFSGNITNAFNVNGLEAEQNEQSVSTSENNENITNFSKVSNDGITGDIFGDDKVITHDSITNPEDKEIYDSLNCDSLKSDGNTLPILMKEVYGMTFYNVSYGLWVENIADNPFC